jgi:hypothetical protein
VSIGHALHAIGHWWVFGRIGRSGLLRAALTALAGWMAIGLVNLYLTRKRIAWRAYMGTEVSLHPQQARRIEEARKAEPTDRRLNFGCISRSRNFSSGSNSSPEIGTKPEFLIRSRNREGSLTSVSCVRPCAALSASGC